MTLVNSSYARPLQGISQQPEVNRNEGQCSNQINMQPDVVVGLKKRAGSSLIKSQLPSMASTDKFHYYRRSDTEAYFIRIGNGGVTVFDVNGNTIPVEYETNAALSYTTSSVTSFARDLQLSTVGDYTFICNSKVLPRMIDGEKSLPISNTALVPVLFADYGKTYSIYLNGVKKASFTTPDGSQPSHILQVDTSYVAEQLRSQFQGTPVQQTYDVVWEEYIIWVPFDYVTAPPQKAWPRYIRRVQIPTGVDPTAITNIACYNSYTNETNHSVMRVEGNYVIFDDYIDYHTQGYVGPDVDWRVNTDAQHHTATITALVAPAGEYLCLRNANVLTISKNGSNFAISTEDGRDGADMPAIMHIVSDVSKLPKKAPVGYAVKVAGRGGSAASQYWLMSSSTTASGDVIWEEALEPNTIFKVNPDTLPQVLVRDYKGDGSVYFRLQKAPWENRKVGNATNNPAPSFIVDGTPITNVGTYQNRLFMLAGESFVASQSNEFFNFFKLTTQTSADDAPIDAYADTDEVSELKTYQHLDGDLVLMSDTAQFVIKGDKALTPANFQMRRATQYRNDSNVKPASTGESLVFSYNVGGATQIREFYTDSYTDTKKARPITEQVSSLLTGDCLQIEAGTHVSTLLVRTSADLRRMYVYDYLWAGNEKVQSAWWKWELPVGDEIWFVKYEQDKLYLLTKRAYLGRCLEVIDLGDPNDTGLTFPVRLDCRKIYPAAKNPLYGHWSVTLPTDVYNALNSEPDNWTIVKGEGCYPTDIGNETFILGSGSSFEEQLGAGTSCSLIIGRKYDAVYQPTMPVVKDSKGVAYGLDRLTVNSMYLNFQNAARFLVRVLNKRGEVREYTYHGRTVGDATNIVGFQSLHSGQFPVPIRDTSEGSKLSIWNRTYLPFVLQGIEWKGQINMRGRRM